MNTSNEKRDEQVEALLRALEDTWEVGIPYQAAMEAMAPDGIGDVRATRAAAYLTLNWLNASGRVRLVHKGAEITVVDNVASA